MNGTDIAAASRLAPTYGAAEPRQVAQAEDILSPFDRAIIGAARVQLRLLLTDVAQVQRDLRVQREMVHRALVHVEQPKIKDRTILATVRMIIKTADTAMATGRHGRVQLRLPLLDPIQVKRDLLVLREAIGRALACLELPSQQGDAALAVVRAIIKRTDEMWNAKWRGR